MIRVEPDLRACAPAYLNGLNLCFPGWGGPETFDWCFARAAGGRPADLLLAEEDGALIAGSAITYRTALRHGRAEPELVACMTGSWTLPSARGRGIFREMIAASRRQAAARGCRLLMAFASSDNPSARAMAAAGARIVPAAYVARTAPRQSARRVAAAEASAAFAEYRCAEPSHLVYSSDEWHGQMVSRPNPVVALRLPSGAYALVEDTGRGARLLDVSSGGPAVFHEAAACTDTAWTIDPDRLATLPVDFAAFPGGVFLFDCGDDPPGAGERWSIANGERM